MTLQEKYDELLMAVGNKYKGETKHETALRYIREAERRDEEWLAEHPKINMGPDWKRSKYPGAIG